MKIACIGNLTYDFTVIGEGFVNENGKASYSNYNINTGGPACNAACVISKFGNPVDFYGQVGNDAFGEYVYQKLIDEGLNVSNLNVSNNVMTPFSFVIINTENATRTINSVRSLRDLDNPSIDNINYQTNYDYILTDGKYPKESIDLIKANQNAISVIDAGRVNNGVIEVCKTVDYIICSEEFANGVTGLEINYEYENDKLVYETMKKLFPDAKGITITIGKYGYISEKDNQVFVNKPYDSGNIAIDTNCAGDIFHGAFTYALANDYDYCEALEFANVTASISTTRVGGKDSCPSLDEVKRALNVSIRKRKR